MNKKCTKSRKLNGYVDDHSEEFHEHFEDWEEYTAKMA